MKKIPLLLFILFFLCACSHDKVIYLSEDHSTALRLAPKNNKKLLIDFYTTWCGACKGYDQHIFTDSTVQAYLKSDFYTLKLDAELPENAEIAKRYNISAYPTLIIADSNGKEFNRIIGYHSDDPSYYITLITRIIQGKENYEYYKAEYSDCRDSLELAIEIIYKLFEQEEYRYIVEFTDYINEVTSNDNLRSEVDVYKGFALLYDKRSPQPGYLKDKLSSQHLLSDYWKNEIIAALVDYYEEVNIDSFEYYNFLLVETNPENFYWNRRFAKYLYEYNKATEIADRITLQYADKNPDDQWTPYLQGLKLVLSNEKEAAFREYDVWMNEHCDPEKVSEDINKYYKYIDLAVFADYRLITALEYAKILERNASTITNRKLLAKLYYMTDNRDLAKEILEETIPLVVSKQEKAQIDKLLSEYSN